MRRPVSDPVRENRADQGVVADAGVEAFDQGVDHGFVYARFVPQALHGGLAPRSGAGRVVDAETRLHDGWSSRVRAIGRGSRQR